MGQAVAGEEAGAEPARLQLPACLRPTPNSGAGRPTPRGSIQGTLPLWKTKRPCQVHTANLAVMESTKRHLTATLITTRRVTKIHNLDLD